jgi:peroxiredoxin
MPKVPRRDEAAADFDLADSTGTSRCLSDLALDGPVVLLFYRGWW